MTTPRVRLRRLLTATLGLALVTSGLGLATGTASAASDPKYRQTTSPEVAYPLVGSRKVVDRRSWTPKAGSTSIAAPCGSSVRSVVPGTAKVVEQRVKGRTRYVVRVQTATPGLWVGLNYVARPAVRDGAVVTPGQRLGELRQLPRSRGCALRVKVHTAKGTVDPTAWLRTNVGRQLSAPPTVTPEAPDAPGFTVASFNILGAKHTTNSKRYATYPSRFRKAMKLLDDRGVDVAGLQEMHSEQADFFAAKGYDKTWGIFHYDPPGRARDTDNAIIYRRSSMEFVEGYTFNIPYFYGGNRAMPAALLREKATGRTAWFLNIHNPASSKKRGDHSKHRARAVQLERQQVSRLLPQGRPVFLTGDFNDNRLAFCPLTKDGLMHSPIAPRTTSGTCNQPRGFWSIDWVFAAGDVTFSNFQRDMYPQDTKINDHPLILATALLGS